MTTIQCLGVTTIEVTNDFMFNTCAQFCMSCLQDRYTTWVELFTYEAPAKVYLLHIVGCSILADKSYVYINVRYMSLFNEGVLH